MFYHASSGPIVQAESLRNAVATRGTRWILECDFTSVLGAGKRYALLSNIS